MDIDGAIFTLGFYAKQGDALGDATCLLDGARIRMAQRPGVSDATRHEPHARRGAVHQRLQLPELGLVGKGRAALLSGVPVIVKPATATAWLTQRMVKDVVDAGMLPAGALSIVCGSSAGLMDQLQAV